MVGHRPWDWNGRSHPGYLSLGGRSWISHIQVIWTPKSDDPVSRFPGLSTVVCGCTDPPCLYTCWTSWLTLTSECCFYFLPHCAADHCAVKSPTFHFCKIKSSCLEVCLLPDGSSFLTCLKNMILLFYLAKVIFLHFEFAFICLSNSHWIHSGKWGVTTFKEVLSTRPDCHPLKIMAWCLVGFPSSPFPVLHRF